MHALQSSIKPLGSWLIRPKPPILSDGNEVSPELQAPEAVSTHCNVRQVQIGAGPIRMYQINDRASLNTREHFIPAQIHDLKTEQNVVQESSRHLPSQALSQVQLHESENIISRDFAKLLRPRRHKHIYYFAGGGWQSPASVEHWRLCAHMAHMLTSKGHPTTVSLVSYPLAPRYPADASLSYLKNWYYEILPTTPPNSIKQGWPGTFKDTDTWDRSSQPEEDLSLTRTKTKRLVQNEEIIFAGDSAGGNVALALPLMVLSRNPVARVPDQLLLICPAVDMRNTNPQMAQIDKLDPVLGLKYSDQCAKTWVGQQDIKNQNGQASVSSSNVEPEDPRVSPLLGDIAVLERRDVVVNGIIAGHDVLGPDARLLRERCQKEGVAGSWLEWDKQMHCFPLAFAHTKHLPESKEAVDWILERLMEDHTDGL